MPFKSKAQMEKFFAMEKRGEIPKGTAKRWAEETPNIKKLPEKKGEKSGKKESKEKSSTGKRKKVQRVKRRVRGKGSK